MPQACVRRFLCLWSGLCILLWSPDKMATLRGWGHMLTLQCSCTQLIVALSLLLLYAAAAAVAAAPAAVLRSCILLRSYAGRCHRVCSYHDHE